MAYQRRPPSPSSRSRHRERMHDPHRASTGSLQQPPPENMYYGGQPMAPAPPAPGPPHGHPHRGPYSTNPHSPQCSSEDLNMNFGYPQSVPPTPGYPSPGWMSMGHPMAGMMAPAPAPAPPSMAPAPGPPPPPGMRGGDGHAHNRMGSLGRRNTQNDKQHRPNIIHQQHNPHPAPHGYDHDQDLEYRQPPRRGAPVNRESRSSSRSRDMSPPGSAGQYVMPGQSVTGRPQSTYHSGSSNFSSESYNMDLPNERPQSYVVPSASHGPGNPREYHLGGPLPGEREFRREGTVYHPNGGNMPVLGEQQRQRPHGRERSRSRGPHHGLGLMDPQASGDGPEESFEDAYRPGGRRAQSSANTNEKGALVRARSRSVPASDSRAMIPQQRGRPSSETSESSSGSEAAPEQGTGQIRIEYGGQTIDINYSGRGGKPPIGNITINTTSRSHTLPLSSPINQRAIAAAPRATPPPATAAIMPPPAEAPAPAPPAPPVTEAAPAPPAPPPPPPPPASVMIPAPPQPSPFVIPPGVEPVVLPPPPQPGIVPPAPGTIAPPRRTAGSDSGVYMDDSDRDLRESLYRNMESLALEGPSSPPFYREERGRDRDIMPIVTAPRAHSRRRRSISRNRKSVDGNEPRWTKISRDIVARRAVEVIGYDFKEQSDSIMVFQVLDEAQIDELIALSERIRSGEVRVIRRDSPTRNEEKEHRHHRRRPSQHRHKSRPVSIHGYPSPGPGPSASRPPPGKPALVSTPPVPPAPEPPQAEAPAPPPPRQQAPPKRPQENPDQPGTYIGYTRNPPRSTQGSGPYNRHSNGKRPN